MDIPEGCKSGYNKGTCTSMLIAPLYTIVKVWKQMRCFTPDEQIKKMWFLYVIVCDSVTKKNEIFHLKGNGSNWSTSS
jgi:hypothetical protein